MPRPPVLLDEGDKYALHPRQPILARLGGILAQRCPACLKGRMFRDRWHLNEKCPGCGHHYRQPVGWAETLVQGACVVLTLVMAAIVFVGLLRVAAHLLPPDSGPATAVLAALAIQVPLVAGIHRYARAIWAHLSVRTTR